MAAKGYTPTLLNGDIPLDSKPGVYAARVNEEVMALWARLGGAVGDSGFFFTNSQAVDDGGKFRLKSQATATAIQGYDAGAFVLEANTAVAGDFSSTRTLLYMTYHDPAQGGGSAVVDDNDFYIFAQNVGINSRNALTYSGASLDTGPVLTMGRDNSSPAALSLLASIDFAARDSVAAFINTRYAYINAYIEDPTAGSTDGVLILATTRGGVENHGFRIGNGVRLTGSFDPGVGNLLATSVVASTLATLGASPVTIATNLTSAQVKVDHVATTAEFLTLNGATSGGRPKVGASLSGGTNVGIDIGSKGTGTMRLYTGSNLALEITDTASATRNVTLTGSNGGNPTIGVSAGSLAISSGLVPAGLVDISGGSAGQIKFPASQNASADANTLDDYEEGTWTPTITFGTPGDLSVAWSAQIGNYTKIGNSVRISFNLISSSFTYTTAAGTLSITGLPFTSANVTNQIHWGPLAWEGITKAGFTNIVVGATPNATTMQCYASGSGQTIAAIAAADMPTAGTIWLRGGFLYNV